MDATRRNHVSVSHQFLINFSSIQPQVGNKVQDWRPWTPLIRGEKERQWQGGGRHQSSVEMHSEDVAIFWDYENCPAASSFTGYEVVKKIRCVAHQFGTVKLFKAYLELSDPATFSKSLVLRSELQSSGVSLTECPHNGRKDVADKMMLVDMLAYAIDNPAPSTIVLISGDRDFAYAVSILRLRRYRVVVISLPGVHTSLKFQASIFLDWNTDVLGAETVDEYSSPQTGTLSRFDDHRAPVSRYLRELPSMERNYAAIQVRGNRFNVEAESDVDIMDHLRMKGNGVRKSRPLTTVTDTNTYIMEDPSEDTRSYAPPPTPVLQESHQDELATREPLLESSSRTESAPAALHTGDAFPTPAIVDKPINAARMDSSPAPQGPLTGSSPPIPLQSLTNAGSFAVLNHNPKPLFTPAPGIGHKSAPSDKPSPLLKTQSPLTFGTMPSTSIITSGNEAVVQGNSPAPAIVKHSEPRVVPPIFKLLVQRLEFHLSKGFPRPFRSGVALELVAQDNTLYRRAGAEKFGQYVAMAEKLGIVELGGREGGAWIALRPEWHNAKIS